MRKVELGRDFGQWGESVSFSRYPHQSLSKMAYRLERFKPLRFDGSVGSSSRERVIERFQESDENDILLMGIRSDGMGLTSRVPTT
jgi:hypothetical protein